MFSLFDFPIIVDAEQDLCLVKFLIISYFLGETSSPGARGKCYLTRMLSVYKEVSY